MNEKPQSTRDKKKKAMKSGENISTSTYVPNI